jgi:hypothetical protein
VGLVLVFYSINSWIAGQGGQPILRSRFGRSRETV